MLLVFGGLAMKANCEKWLFCADAFRSVLATAAKGRRSYTPFGFSPCVKGGEAGLAYNGELRPATGAYLLGHGYRAYNPVLMRFHSPDSWSPLGAGGLNCYCYCKSDPVNALDPSGHKSKWLQPQYRVGLGEFDVLASWVQDNAGDFTGGRARLSLRDAGPQPGTVGALTARAELNIEPALQTFRVQQLAQEQRAAQARHLLETQRNLGRDLIARTEQTFRRLDGPAFTATFGPPAATSGLRGRAAHSWQSQLAVLYDSFEGMDVGRLPNPGRATTRRYLQDIWATPYHEFTLQSRQTASAAISAYVDSLATSLTRIRH